MTVIISNVMVGEYAVAASAGKTGKDKVKKKKWRKKALLCFFSPQGVGESDSYL